MTGDALLDYLVEKGEALRKAGIVRLNYDNMGSFTVELAPPQEPTVIVQADREERESMDPLMDPDTFGGRMPGYRRRRNEDDE